MNICTKIHKMDSGIFDSKIFDSLVPCIIELNSNGRVEIVVPPQLSLDFETIKTYFKEDATLFFERGKPILIKGTLKYSDVTNYLMDKVKML